MAARKSLFTDMSIDTVLDVGANTGQFALQIRREGFAGRIISFEPLSTAYAKLATAAADDPLWNAYHCALGSTSGSAQINIAGNSWSSSILPMLESHRTAAPESAYVGTEEVTIRTLDETFTEVCRPAATAFMKVDTQGFTMNVFRGGEDTLTRLAGLQVEMSLVALYADEPLIPDLLAYLYGRGFRLVYIEPEFWDSRGLQLQVNGLFVKT